MQISEVSPAVRKQLDLEVVSERARVRLTRLVRQATVTDDPNVELIRRNRAINIARTALGLEVYVLESDDLGEYQPSEHAWHNGEIELILRRPTTAELAEILMDLIHDGLDHEDVNAILDEENASFRFETEYDIEEGRQVRIEVLSVSALEERQDASEHPNIRALAARMEAALEHEDPAGALAASAAVFETLAKDVVGRASVADETLGAFFERYRKDSRLPPAVLDYILEIYKRRNTEPLAGHGSMKQPQITQEEAIILSEMTKAFVRAERQLLKYEISRRRTEKNG